MIEIKNLYLKYIREYFALYNINLKIDEGECVALTGEKHSGRTTLLRTIAGLEKFDQGEIFIAGREIKNIDFKTDIELGYIPEKPVFLDNKSVYENLQYILKERKTNKNEIDNKINNILINFHIEKYRNIKIRDLNLFEKYLLSFVRLFLRDIKIILIDDIFSNLKKDESSALIALIKENFVDKKITTLIVCDKLSTLETIKAREIHFVSGSIEN